MITDLSKIKIVLVEDNPDDAYLTLRAMKNLNLENNVIHLKNGEEAINFIIKKLPIDGKVVSPDVKLVLLDLRMPKVSGVEVLQEIRKNPATAGLPVVVLTASHDDPDIQRCKELGANSYIIKPVTAERFSKVIEEVAHYWTELNKI